MKFKHRFLFLALGLALALLAIPTLAKAPVSKMVIEHPGLVEPIEITDPEFLDRFHPGPARFIGMVGPFRSPPDVGLQIPYQVYSYFDNGWGELELSYVFYYYPNSPGKRGYIYFPGKGEPYYPVNVRLVLRGESDGGWHQSAPVWERAFARALQE